MKNILSWWYRISLPQHRPTSNPKEREHERYARLTAGLLFLLCCVFLPVSPILLFFSPASPSSPPVGVGMIMLLALSFISGRAGQQMISAICIIIWVFFGVTVPLLTNPLDASLLPVFSTFTIAVVLAGALMPPIAALITGALSCLDISLIGLLSLLHPAMYNPNGQIPLRTINVFSLAVVLPIAIQIIVSVIVYIIMTNQLNALKRAEHAEEVIALQKEINEHERERSIEKRQLEEGFHKIADTHARIANGDYQARVSLKEGDILWSVAIPLNNLLNRLQHWKTDADMLNITKSAANHVTEQIRHMFKTGRPHVLQLTGTPLDPVIIEINRMLTTQRPDKKSVLP